jgi:pimeloyl-ACP methyl ester carboxylesterase
MSLNVEYSEISDKELATRRALYKQQKENDYRRLRLSRYLAFLLLLITAVAAFTTVGPVPYVFAGGFFLMLVMQVITTRFYRRLLDSSHQWYAAGAGVPWHRFKTAALTPTTLGVFYTYFFLFACFQLVWLLKAYFHPLRADSFGQIVSRLGVGSMSGKTVFVLFIVFLAVYGILFIMGSYRRDDFKKWFHAPAEDSTGDNNAPDEPPRRVPFTVRFRTWDDRPIHLDGFQMPNPGKQPLILWPGLYQNGFLFDLEPGRISLAKFLWDKGYDIFAIHSRGTAGSGWKWKDASMDDYALTDIPAIIEYVTHCTGQKPLYFGHSQGGITALFSMMGAAKDGDGKTVLSNDLAEERQSKLKVLVTAGSFPDLNPSENNKGLDNLVRNGVYVKILGLRIKVLTAPMLMFVTRILRYLPVPIGRQLRHAMLRKKYLRVLLLPLMLILDFVAYLKLWSFLFHIPNVSKKSRRSVFYKTQDATYHGILNQFQKAAADHFMTSTDENVNYSQHYNRISLPVSLVGMELDPLADAINMEKYLFASVSSKIKFFTLLKGQGHEDFCMNPDFFPLLYETIRKVEEAT